ncbi:MAG: hypothetical protein DMG92_17680, partial [Acidobacteria bacterium]
VRQNWLYILIEIQMPRDILRAIAPQSCAHYKACEQETNGRASALRYASRCFGKRGISVRN